MESAKIIHVDMDCFYAQVEMRDNPSLKGKPVVISGPPNSRSVVCTASYEARKYGVHAALSAFEAYKRCPEAVFIPPNFDKYRAVSKKLHEIFHRYTDLVEPLSLDEAYLDISQCELHGNSATLIAQEIQNAVLEELNLTCSIGVSFNKLLAKIGSDYKKPFGITVIQPHEGLKFCANLDIKAFPGVGKKARTRLHEYGVYTGSDFHQFSKEKAERLFGKLGISLYQYTRAVDNRIVSPYREPKSVGCEYTLHENVSTKAEVSKIFEEISHETLRRVKKKKRGFKTVTIKIKYQDFTQITRSKSLVYYEQSQEVINKVAQELLNYEHLNGEIRLLGITVSNLIEEEEVAKQLRIEQVYLDVR